MPRTCTWLPAVLLLSSCGGAARTRPDNFPGTTASAAADRHSRRSGQR